ncbi:hypothetical protein HDU93_008031 [Gonapodya sp. JEL0774]|nr:hypothetical protein HDU93_008031 [Gonapodya sp. JEL0774]
MTGPTASCPRLDCEVNAPAGVFALVAWADAAAAEKEASDMTETELGWCGVLTCRAPLNASEDCLVRIRISPRHIKQLTALPATENPIAWAKNGLAACHARCWDAVLEKARDDMKAKKPRTANPPGRRTRAPTAPSATGASAGHGGEHSSHPSKGRIIAAQRIVDAEETAERIDTPSKVREAALQLAEAIKTNDGIMFFTGAGISTAAGIGDYRGLFGKWNEQDLKVAQATSSVESAFNTDDSSQNDNDDDGDAGVPYDDLRPTLTHEAIAWIVASKPKGACTVVTQNCDGLHELTGLTPDILAPLHGCVYTEVCTNPACRSIFTRTFYVLNDAASAYFENLQDAKSAKARRALGPPPPNVDQCPTCQLTHSTGRSCPPPCNTPLKDTIINFGDDLDERVWSVAEASAKKAPLRIVLGSTVLVTPASTLVTDRVRKKMIVVCNRQASGADDIAGIRVYCDCDTLMEQVMLVLLGSERAYAEWTESIEHKRKDYDKIRSQHGEKH